MVSILAILGVAALIGVGFVVYDIFFSNKGQKVLIETYRMVNNVIVRTNVKGNIIGYMRRDNGVDKLFLPKKFSKVPIEGVKDNDLVMTTAEVPIMRLLQRGEGLFNPIRLDQEWYLEKRTENGKEVQEKLPKMRDIVLDREMVQWAITEEKLLAERHKTEKKANWMPAVILGSAIIIAGIIILGSINMAKSLYQEEAGKLLEETQETQSLASRTLEIIQGGGTNQKNTNIQTNASAPPSGGATS